MTSSSTRRPRTGCLRRCSCSAWTSPSCRTKQGMLKRGTVLAFDFGLKRIGVAVGEPELKTAHPLPAVSSFEKIQSLVAEWQPSALVVGRPTSVQGAEHAMTKRSDVFARRLEKKFKLPVARV